ncbi:MAG: hypothetical protein ACRBF0_22835 [Calditrichia bacterium]
MRVHIYSILIALIYLGCSPVQHFVPINPPGKGQYEIRVGVDWALNKLMLPNPTFGMYYGLSDRDAIGVSAAALIIPNNVSYVRYWDGESVAGNFQLHLNSLIGGSLDPVVDIRAALTSRDSNTLHSLSAGLAYYQTPFLWQAFGRSSGLKKTLPVVGYTLQSNDFQMDIDFIPGTSRYLVEKTSREAGFLNRDARFLIADSGNFAGESEKVKDFGVGTSRKMMLFFTHDKVVNYDVNPNSVFGTQYTFFLRNGFRVDLFNRPPYPDCIPCGLEMRKARAFIGSPEHKVYWVSVSDNYGMGVATFIRELNIDNILKGYKNGGALNLEEGEDHLKKKLKRIDPFPHDFFFSVASRERKRKL